MITICFVSPSDFHRSSQSLSLLDPMAIKKFGDDHSALTNGSAIHGLSLFPAEEIGILHKKGELQTGYQIRKWYRLSRL
jgi:hypothetical protein